jgi:hypothetical protein
MKQENCTFCEGTGQIVSSTTISGFKTCDCIIISQEEHKQETTRTMKTAVEWLAEQMLWNEFHNPYLEQAKEMEKEEKGYSKEDLFKILLDFVAFPHHDMEPRGSIIERYLNELSNKKLNN